MPLDNEQIRCIEDCLPELLQRGGSPLPELRKRFPGVLFVRCNAEDMDGQPYRAGDGYSLFLIDCTMACINIASSPATADGIVIATK